MGSHAQNQDRADEMSGYDCARMSEASLRHDWDSMDDDWVEDWKEARRTRRFNRFLAGVAIAAFVGLFLLTALACTPESDYQKEQH